MREYSDVSKHWITALATAALALGFSCHSNDQETTIEPAATEPAAEIPQPAAEPAGAPPAADPAPAVDDKQISGKVVETMDASGYTYALVDTGTKKVWAAGPQVALTIGEEVSFDGSLQMVDHHSPTLDKTFDVIYFTEAIKLDVPALFGHGKPATPDESGVKEVEMAEGGVTVESVFTKKADLIGTEIVLRGEVVKYTPEIMGKNWMHIQDGTGSAGTNDLTITTDAKAEVGDTVLVRGVLVADKDFGYGYKYDLIIEDAKVTVE
jgi:hypothetical protein